MSRITPQDICDALCIRRALYLYRKTIPPLIGGYVSERNKYSEGSRGWKRCQRKIAEAQGRLDRIRRLVDDHTRLLSEDAIR